MHVFRALFKPVTKSSTIKSSPESIKTGQAKAETSAKEKKSSSLFEPIKFAYKVAYYTGKLPLMIANLLMYTILGLSPAIVLKFQKIFTKLLEGTVKRKLMIANCYTVAVTALVKVLYMNIITVDSRLFTNNLTKTVLKHFGLLHNKKILKDRVSIYSGKKSQIRAQAGKREISNSDKWLPAANLFAQSTIQGIIAVLTTTLSLTLNRLVMTASGCCLFLIALTMGVQYYIASPKKEKQNDTRQQAQGEMEKMYLRENMPFVKGSLKAIASFTTANDNVAKADLPKDIIYRIMTELAETLIAICIIGTLVPSLPVAAMSTGFSASTAITATGLLLLIRQLAGMFKDGGSIPRSSTNLSDASSNFNGLQRIFSDIKEGTSYDFFDSLRYHNKIKRNSSFIREGLTENLVIGLAFSASINLFYDSMIYYKLIEGTAFLSTAAGTTTLFVTAGAFLALLCYKKFIRNTPNPEIEDAKYDNTCFSIAAGIVTSFAVTNLSAGTAIATLLSSINPIVGFTAILATTAPLWSYVANKFLIPKIDYKLRNDLKNCDPERKEFAFNIPSPKAQNNYDDETLSELSECRQRINTLPPAAQKEILLDMLQSSQANQP